MALLANRWPELASLQSRRVSEQKERATTVSMISEWGIYVL